MKEEKKKKKKKKKKASLRKRALGEVGDERCDGFLDVARLARTRARKKSRRLRSQRRASGSGVRSQPRAAA